MTESSFEEGLLQIMSTQIRNNEVKVIRDDTYARLLSRRFPFVLSRLAFWKIEGYCVLDIESSNTGESLSGILDKLSEIAGICEDDKIVVLGDALFDLDLVMPYHLLRKFVRDIVEIPQHTYVLPPDGSWCASFTMEEDFMFAFAPTSEDLEKIRKNSSLQ